MPSRPKRPPIREQFAQRLQRPCEVLARAPGRVSLIGEHTDYNDGFVLPMALEQCTWVAAAQRPDGLLRVVALDLNAAHTWSIDAWRAADHPDWTAYLTGVALLLRRRGVACTGADLVVQSAVPVGGGLSSSAALEVSAALALGALAGHEWSPIEVADLARRAEHEFARVPCGLMDQYVSVLARDGHAFLLDCRARSWEHIPLALDGHVVVVVNSGVRHKLAAGEYACRQDECCHAVEHLRQSQPGLRSLRDVSPNLLTTHSDALPAVLAKRARHVVSENARTQAAAHALRHGDLAEFGRLMLASHTSLRDDYEVSCPEVDRLVDIVSTVPGVLGARMTGGGFGGCIVALVRADCLSTIADCVQRDYDQAGYGPAQLLTSRPGPGASVENRQG